MDFIKYINDNKEQFLNDLNELLKIDTVLVEQPEIKEAPFGENLVKALNYMLSLGAREGFITKNIENVAGHIEYGEGEEVIGVLCHLDVVPTGDGWTYPPFEPTIVDGKIYARGSMDDKGACISSLYALKALKESGVKLNKKIRLIFGTDEETGSRGIKRYLEVEKMPDLGFSPDADYPIIYAEKGITSFDLLCDAVNDEIVKFESGDRYNVVPEIATVQLKNDYKEKYLQFLKEKNYNGEVKDNQYIMYGKRAHAMEPRNGVNAIIRLVEFLNTIIDDKYLQFIYNNFKCSRLSNVNQNFTDPEMGDLTSNLALLNIKDNKGSCGINFRYPINWDKEKYFSNLNDEAKKDNVEVKVLNDSVPHYIPKDHYLVKTLHKSYIKYTNDDKTPLMTIGGGTYARSLKCAVAFGPMMPGREDVVHQVDEYAYIDDLLISVAIFADALQELGK